MPSTKSPLQLTKNMSELGFGVFRPKKKPGYGKVRFHFLALDEKRSCAAKLIWLQRALSLPDIACQANRTDNHLASVTAICYLQTCNKFNTIIPSLSHSK